MDKKDIMYGIIALVIILVIALVVKPLVTGHPINTGIPVPTTPIPKTTQGVPLQNYSQVSKVVVSSTTVPTPTPTPTPVPTWNSAVVQGEFVNPSTYGVSFNQSIPNGPRVENIPKNTSMTTYATISGQYSGTTSIMYIPFPYWELWYTADPAGPIMGEGQTLSSTTVTYSQESSSKNRGSSQTVIQGSYSVVNPTLSIQVMDGDDPNRIVRTITPPGGLDESLWVTQTDENGNIISQDPRPWIEKFFEGQRNYFFIITAQSLNSYELDIRVPTSYIGEY